MWRAYTLTRGASSTPNLRTYLAVFYWPSRCGELAGSSPPALINKPLLPPPGGREAAGGLLYPLLFARETSARVV